MALAAVAGGSAVSMTLMACYGAGCVDDDCREPYDGDAAADARRPLAQPTLGDAGPDVDATRDAADGG
jgi:hypothetical protein